MSTSSLAQHTYLPSAAEDLAEVFDFLAAHQARGGDVPLPQYVLAGPGKHDRVEVPAEVHRALLQVVESLKAGRAVTIAPQSLSLTTQQAADLLNVSRPTVVKLLDTGEIAHDRVGHRRKVMLRDVLQYRDRRRQAQYDALAATSAAVDEEDPQQVLNDLKAARHAVAAKRREQQR